MNLELTAAGQRKITLALLAIIACLITASTAGQAMKYLLGFHSVKGLVPLFYVDNEANVPAWYSSLALAMAALVLATIAFVQKWRRDPFRYHWAALAALFLLLSLDEIAGLHELPIDGLREVWHATGAMYYPWVVFGGLFALAVGIGFMRLLISLPRQTRNGILLAGAVFLGGALGVEMLSGLQASRFGEENFTYALIITAEEALEMLGIAIFIHTLMNYLRSLVGVVHIDLQPGSDRSSTTAARLGQSTPESSTSQASAV